MAHTVELEVPSIASHVNMRQPPCLANFLLHCCAAFWTAVSEFLSLAIKYSLMFLVLVLGRATATHIFLKSTVLMHRPLQSSVFSRLTTASSTLVLNTINLLNFFRTWGNRHKAQFTIHGIITFLILLDTSII